MSMPGFVFHFHCPACGQASDEYALFVFPSLVEPSLSLPAWSRELCCYASVRCDLLPGDRQRLENDLPALVALAAKLSSPALTVGVPRMVWGTHASAFTVEVSPECSCPYCGATVEARVGYAALEPVSHTE